MRKKKNESIWHALITGIPANAEKKKYYYEICPGLALKLSVLAEPENVGSQAESILYSIVTISIPRIPIVI